MYGHVITKFSRMGRLPHFLTHGAPLARFARENSAKKKWEGLSSATKAKYAKRKKTGCGAIELTDVDEVVTEIIGKENISFSWRSSLCG